MNKYLLNSSIINGFIILLIINDKYNPKYNILYLCIILGIITSLLNHGCNSIICKYIDRFIIVLNVFVFIYFIMQQKNNQNNRVYTIAIIIVACIAYLICKLQKNIILRNILHQFSHFLSVILVYFFHI